MRGERNRTYGSTPEIDEYDAPAIKNLLRNL
jgi:hypothetical protein